MTHHTSLEAKMRAWKVCLIVAVLALAASACAAGSPAGASLANTKWTLVSFGAPDAENPVIVGTNITLEFQQDGQAGGSGGCNSYGAQYKVQGDTISFSQIVSTLMACTQEGVDQQEQRYFAALQATGQFELAGDLLTIQYDNGQGVLNFAKGAE
jgi:heat shock protein HslJ